MTQGERTIDLVPHLRRSDPLQIDFPALPGWADVWRSALRALHLWRSLPCHFSLNLPQASQLLGMTKESAKLPWKAVAGRRPTQGDERAPVKNHLLWSRRSFLCHPERQPRDLQFSGPFVETRNHVSPQICHLDRSAPGFPATQRWIWQRVRLSLRKAA
jgi:hypothetical protein